MTDPLLTLLIRVPLAGVFGSARQRRSALGFEDRLRAAAPDGHPYLVDGHGFGDGSFELFLELTGDRQRACELIQRVASSRRTPRRARLEVWDIANAAQLSATDL